MTEVDLVTGFLGAGKTTFIKRYGRCLQSRGVDFAVIENEFGAPGVDTAILRQEFSHMTEISGGCICCTMKTSFHQLLKELSETCERIIVEPSGIFNSDDFFDILRSPDLSGKCRAGMCVMLVDPHTTDKLGETERSVFASEIASVGCVVWTKTDVEPLCDLNHARACIQDIISEIGIDRKTVSYYPTPSYQLKDEDFARLQGAQPVYREHRRVFTDHTMIFQSARLYPDGEYTVENLDHCIAQMTASPEEYGEISRIKGFVKARQGLLAVNCTVSDRLFEHCEDGAVLLNIIGRKLNRKKISQCLAASAVTS